MKNLRPETLGILQQIETLSGRPVEFKPDASLTLRATLQLARNGASAHVLRYRPVNEPLDYWVAYQAGYLLRLLELPPSERFDFAGTGSAPARVEELLTAGLKMTEAEQSAAPRFAEAAAHWAMMNLRSFAIGMRIDQWLADDHPELRALQAQGIEALQQENLRLLSQRAGRLAIPVPLLAPLAAGALDAGAELLAIVDRLPPGPAHDRELVDAWAGAIGMTGWYTWVPYRP